MGTWNGKTRPDHCPLFRQSEIYAREGVDLDRSTLAGWVGASSELLAPLVEALRKHVLAARFMPTTRQFRCSLLATARPRPAASGPMYATSAVLEKTPRQQCGFAYSPDRKGEHPCQHLKNFKGALQADAYAGFHHLYDSGNVYEVACWAHARRKFHECVDLGGTSTKRAQKPQGALGVAVQHWSAKE